MKIQSLAATALVVFWFAGCSAVYVAYPPEGGQQKAVTANIKSAVLVNAADSHIWIMRVDGKQERLPSHGQYQFLPGRHLLRVQYYWSNGYLTWTGNDLADYSFDVKAGAKLKVMCQHTEETSHSSNDIFKGTWKLWIEDASSGVAVATEDSEPIVAREATGERNEPVFFPFERMGS